jgi:membrane fusion protein, multidrug efflux system
VIGRLPFRFGIALVVAGVAAAAAAFLAGASWPLLGSPAADPQPPAPAIPVIAGKAVRADIPVYLTGLGAVQAYNSVLVKSRVDGQLVKLGFVEGQNVRAGDVLAEIDPHPYEAALAQAQAAQLKDQAQLANARLDLTRANRLVTSGAGTTQQQDAMRAQVAQLEAGIKGDQALIDTAQIQLNYSRIRSPIDGRAGTRLLDAGNIVRAGDTNGIVTINQLRPIWVAFSLPATSLPEIRVRQAEGAIPVTAEDGNSHDLATGTLAVIDNQINAATATIAYKAVFTNDGEVLWPGQFVNIRLQLRVERGALTVPSGAIVRGPDGPYVFVIGADRSAKKRPVKLGFATATTTIIADGLSEGDQVVTDGQYRVQAGSVVEILEKPTAASGVGQ